MEVHNLRGTPANGYNLCAWASGNPKRLSVWKIYTSNTTDFPDESSEWCALNLQDDTGGRGIVVAFKYTSATPSVKYRCYYNGGWLGEWNSILN